MLSLNFKDAAQNPHDTLEKILNLSFPRKQSKNNKNQYLITLKKVEFHQTSA